MREFEQQWMAYYFQTSRMTKNQSMQSGDNAHLQ